jgi:hypothetical protein
VSRNSTLVERECKTRKSPTLSLPPETATTHTGPSPEATQPSTRFFTCSIVTGGGMADPSGRQSAKLVRAIQFCLPCLEHSIIAELESPAECFRLEESGKTEWPRVLTAAEVLPWTQV